ncbi:MAG TPA: formylglycine-generating enzyme family protein, partial [Negativicutes bacterium]|nr:formylglycine-generating enzyme family protein [Negativicutes bacterium]
SLPACRFHDPDLPVETINWMEAERFCHHLSQLTDRDFILPSEAHWEYACRAGTQSAFNIGDNITTDYVNYVGEHTYRDGPRGIYLHETNRAGTYPPNRWGLFDMHGNVWEFCQDSWCDDYNAAPVTATARTSIGRATTSSVQSNLEAGSNWLDRYWNNRGAGSQKFRVARGGSWHETPTHCRSAVRLRVAENERLEYYGLRVMLLEDQKGS